MDFSHNPVATMPAVHECSSSSFFIFHFSLVVVVIYSRQARCDFNTLFFKKKKGFLIIFWERISLLCRCGVAYLIENSRDNMRTDETRSELTWNSCISWFVSRPSALSSVVFDDEIFIFVMKAQIFLDFPATSPVPLYLSVDQLKS